MAGNAAAYSFLQLISFLIPALLLPYLARVLTPIGWGRFILGQSFGMLAGLVVEYGFMLSGPSALGKTQHSRQQSAEVLATILGARLALTAVAVASAVFVRPWLGPLGEDSELFWSSLFFGLAFSWGFLWFFQGIERAWPFVWVDLAARVCSAILIVILVKMPEHGPRVLQIQGLGFLVSLFGGLILAVRVVPFQWPTPSLAFRGLSRGRGMFVFRLAESVYQMGTPFVLGLFAPVESVAFFAGADRIVKVVGSMLQPINQALLPRLSYTIAHHPDEADRLFRHGAGLVTILGFGAAVCLWFGAPVLVPILLGPEFGPAILLLQTLAPVVFFVAIKTAYGFQWFIPRGMDWSLVRVIVLSGCLHLVLVMLLVPQRLECGMTVAVVLTEAFVAVALLVIFLRLRKTPAPQRRLV